MAMTINISTNFPEVKRSLDRLDQDVGFRVLVRAMNATVEHGKTQMARKISQEFRIKVGSAKDRLRVRRAQPIPGTFRFDAILAASRPAVGRSMNVIAFVTTAPRRLKSGRTTQLKFQIKRSGGRKQVKGAFIGNKGRTVFIRKGNERLPIEALNTIDVPQMFNARRINDAVRKVMLERFEANFSRELRAVLGGFAR